MLNIDDITMLTPFYVSYVAAEDKLMKKTIEVPSTLSKVSMFVKEVNKILCYESLNLEKYVKT